MGGEEDLGILLASSIASGRSQLEYCQIDLLNLSQQEQAISDLEVTHTPGINACVLIDLKRGLRLVLTSMGKQSHIVVLIVIF